MIVRNESRVIKRCLASVKPIIDYWIIIDTGSNDGTQDVIREFMKDIPGELHEYPWVDFAHNRNQALALSKGKGDYLLFIDADERLLFDDSLQLSSVNKDYYFFPIKQPSGINYFRECLIKSNLDWKWIGPVHETIVSAQSKTYDVLAGVINLSNTEDGNRSRDPEKYLKDAAVLEKALQEEPENSRYVFYLALSYGNAKEYRKALKWHEKRVSMGDSEQEVFYSLLTIGKIHENLGSDFNTVVNSYTKAYLYRPSRGEPLYYLANYYLQRENFVLSYLLVKLGLTLPTPGDIIFVQHNVYDMGFYLQWADTAYRLGKYEEALQAYEKLLKNPNITIEQRAKLGQNKTLVKELICQQLKQKNIKHA